MSRTLHLFGTDWCAMMVPIQVIRWYRMQCYDGTDSCAIVVPFRRYCQAANKVGIIPDICIPNGIVNLSQCCHYLSGNPAEQLGIRYGKLNERVVPKHIQDIMFLVLTLGNTNSHTTELNEEEEHTLSTYIHTNVYNSSYLIYSLALQICEVVMWMNQYISTHQNIEENKNKCQRIQVGTQKDDKSETPIAEGIIEPIKDCPNLYHIGTYYCIAASYVTSNNLIGKKVKVIKQETNTDSKTKEQYPYFAKKISLI